MRNVLTSRNAVRVALVAALAAGLAACDGGGGGDTQVTPDPPAPPPAAQLLEDLFGTGFGQIFRFAANSDPRDPQPSDLAAVSFTTDPIPVP